jgi:major membrane immunogen (membrane-anchored lipoprotein)|tara:strand:+ start:256 stop:468 length:213 start_codon:yes stop_codon:yes gene_type:complete
MKKLMFSMAIISAMNIMGCTIYDGMSMKPHKTSVTTTYGQDEVDKANDNKDQTKDSMQITVKQDFIWEDN